MYSVSDAFKNAIKEPVIEYGIIGQIGNTQFTEENVIAGSMTVSNQCTDTNDIVLGSAYVGQLTATFTGIQLNRYDWLDKVVSFAIRVQLPNNQHEDVPMGYYTIKEVYHTAEGVQIKAYDNMHKFDKLFDATHFDFNGKPYAFLNTICSDCGVTLGMSQSEVEDLPNGEHKMYLCGARKDTTDYASDIETYRDALFYLAQACACFATIDRQGRLVLRRYRQGKVDTITELHRLAGAEFSDYVTSYNGLYVTSLWDGRTTYYGYDIEELQESRVEAIERQGEEQDAVDDIEAEIAELVRKHDAHEITDEEYAQQRAQLDAELQAAESTLKMTTKYIKKNPNKKTRRNLTFANMVEYMKTQENSEDLLAEFETMKSRSKIQASPYQYVLSWFEGKFEGYNDLKQFMAQKEEERSAEDAASETAND